MKHLRILPLLILLAAPALASTEREQLEDRIRWLESLLAKERAKLAKLEAALLAAERERVGRNPGPIAPTGRAVTPATKLYPGLELQVEWGGRWWAARVLSISPKGDRVRVHYLGWDFRWDEFVSRARLQIDPAAAEKARAAGTYAGPVPIVIHPVPVITPDASSGKIRIRFPAR